jgi:hypothetical protein
MPSASPCSMQMASPSQMSTIGASVANCEIEGTNSSLAEALSRIVSAMRSSRLPGTSCRQGSG